MRDNRSELETCSSSGHSCPLDAQLGTMQIGKISSSGSLALRVNEPGELVVEITTPKRIA